ncbi:MAG: serine hydrolase [Candidatus Sumerlaeota bacterium]|nr:serine hydrolase [Candidatus Sumerlaeota bacterium]
MIHAHVHAAVWENLTDAEATSAGWSREKLAAAREYAATLNTEAAMIVTRGKVLDSWGAVDRKINVHSIRKSFLSAMYGIQVEAGKLRLNATMADLGIDDNEPRLTEVEKRATVHDLLKSRSGIYHPALYETARMKAQRPQRHSHEPGAFWYYNNWDFNVLGAIYEQQCKAAIYEDFRRLIAEPLGMEDYEVSDGKYVTGADSIHRAYPFRMTARDMARFGLLFLRGGQWNGKQVVPAAWVKESVTSYSEADVRGGYGYLWWIARGGLHLPGVTLPEGSYSARGTGGHYILNVPALDLVIVHRVNTDIVGRRVEAAEFGELTRRILLAYQPPPVKQAIPEALDTLLPLLMSKHRVPGAAVVGIVDGRIAFEKYLGAQEAGKERLVDAETVFEAGSMTKPLAAYAALKLVEQGKLDLDRPLARYLTEPYLKDEPLHERITARMALTHTSGFPNWRPKDGPLKLMHAPGTAYLYSGEGFQFLQSVMERISGENYEGMMRRMALEPLGMKNSSHVWRDALAAKAAAGHNAEGKVKANRRLYSKPNAAYSLYCAPRDYAAFAMEMMKADRSGPHSISAASVRAMLTPASPPTGRELLTRRGSTGVGDVRYGLGWFIEPTASGPRICHSGANGAGFRSYVEFDPVKGHGLIIMTNSDSGADFWKELVGYIGIP